MENLIENLSEKLSNAKLRDFASLNQKKNRQLNGLYIIEGIKLVSEAIESKTVISAIVYETGFDFQKLLGNSESGKKQLNIPPNIPIFEAKSKDFERLTEMESPEGIVAICKIPLIPQMEKTPLPKESCLAIFQLNDPGNLGTLLRTADWFGISNIILVQPCADIFNSKTVRASMGAIFRLNFFDTQNTGTLVDLIKSKSERFVMASMNGIPSNDFKDWQNDSILIIGNESHGTHYLQHELNKKYPNTNPHQISIPKFGKTESLNAGIAGGILMYDWKKK